MPIIGLSGKLDMQNSLVTIHRLYYSVNLCQNLCLECHGGDLSKLSSFSFTLANLRQKAGPTGMGRKRCGSVGQPGALHSTRDTTHNSHMAGGAKVKSTSSSTMC